jgi:uncharacterized protein YgiM (DUF1202 family)
MIAGLLGIGGWCAAQPVESPPAAESASPAAAFVPYVGEVTGDSVYIRSGPSTNYYTVGKASAGQRVTVLAEKENWIAVAPPPNCFSLIDARFVDRDRDPTVGIVNGERVNVRAGAEGVRDPYAVQTQLDRGARVRILGDFPNGFLRITPPEGAKLWIFGQYVQRVEGVAVTATTDTPAGVPTTQPAGETVTASRDVTRITIPAAPAGQKAAEGDRAVLEDLEAAVKAEMTKPLFERNVRPLADKFQALANQTKDEYTVHYAKTRVAQLLDLAATIESVKKAYDVHSGIAGEREQFARDRERIKTVRIRETEGFAAQGELRESAVYASPTGPRRYRLLDPGKDVTRTLAYVEIPPDSPIDVTKYLGRRVGVRAQTKQLKVDSVDPVPIIVAEELVLLEDRPKAE